MVLTTQGMPSGPLGGENFERLRLVRFSVIGLWAFALIRLVVDNPLNGLATAFAAATGTYTFMNDKRLEGCYEFMSNNCVICGPGGTQCMGPFMSICVINAIFDLFRIISLWNAGVASLLPIASISIAVSVILQAYCFYACIQVFKELVQRYEPSVPERSYVRLAGEGTGNPPASGFVPFSGEGRRLGS